MSSSVQIVPAIILPLSFLFVLLIILIVKAPKVGAWVVGGLILLAPLVLWRFMAAGLPAQPDAEALIVLPAAYLFVLLIILLTKAPKAGAGIIVALVVMGLFGAMFVGRHAVVQTATVHQETPWPPAIPEPLPARPIPQPPMQPAPIWSAGVDQELDADVYPSQSEAVRSLGRRIARQLRVLVPDANMPKTISLLPAMPDAVLGLVVKDALREYMPETTFSVVAGGSTDSYVPVAVGIQSGTVARGQVVESGHVEAILYRAGKEETRLKAVYSVKPWVNDFAAFANTRPEQAFIIARSLGTCTSEGEANQQALDDARRRLTEALGQRGDWTSGRLPRPEITATDVLQGGFVADRFAQSFEGMVGKIWRQALLIDVSGPKLAQLAGQKAREFRQVKMTWARMGFSAIGVMVLIGVIYFFLNMATMGYYEWSLRIACVVLAIVGVLSILMVVK